MSYSYLVYNRFDANGSHDDRKYYVEKNGIGDGIKKSMK